MCFAWQSYHRYLPHYEHYYLFFAGLGLYLREKEKNKTDSTQKQVTYTVQPSFPQRLLTFLPNGDN